jgi:hypothetical protein
MRVKAWQTKNNDGFSSPIKNLNPTYTLNEE